MSVKQEFNKYFNYLVHEGIIPSCTLKELCYKCYCQGDNKSQCERTQYLY